jgi:hypothetical protein
MDVSASRATSQRSTHENTPEIKNTSVDSHERSDLPLSSLEAGETSDEDSGLGQPPELDDTESALTHPQFRSLSPNQLSSQLTHVHLARSEPSVNARSISRGREGYGFRPPSGGSTPTPVGIPGVRVQRGTNVVVDRNGLGWPGMRAFPLPSLAHFDLLTIEQKFSDFPNPPFSYPYVLLHRICF